MKFFEELKSNWKRSIMGTLKKFSRISVTNLSRLENDEMFDLKTNVLIWGLFMSTTMKSAVRFGREYQQNWIACRNTNFEEIKTLFDITLRLIVDNSSEILNLSTTINDFSPWMRSTLCHDQVIKWAKAKVHVYSDSVLCLGKMHSHRSE